MSTHTAHPDKPLMKSELHRKELLSLAAANYWNLQN